MIAPATLSAAVTAKLQAIPELVTLLGGDASLVGCYETDYPDYNTSVELLNKLPSPSVTVMWGGTDAGNSKRAEVWQHSILVLIKSTENNYSDYIVAIANGTPSSSSDDGLRFIRTTIHPNCDPCGPFSAIRRQLYINERTAVDFFELSLTLAERGREA